MNDSVDFDDDDFEDDEDEFDHFVAAQDTVYGTVVTELTDGKKQTHWTWFIFPVLTGIGESPMAMFYSLRDTAEAKAYLTDRHWGIPHGHVLFLARHRSG